MQCLHGTILVLAVALGALVLVVALVVALLALTIAPLIIYFTSHTRYTLLAATWPFYKHVLPGRKLVNNSFFSKLVSTSPLPHAAASALSLAQILSFSVLLCLSVYVFVCLCVCVSVRWCACASV